DSLLLMDKGIMINTTDKFRNQQVEVTIYVPVGSRIKIDKSFGYRNRVTLNDFTRNRNWYDYQENNGYSFNYGIEYIMKADGLFTLTGSPSSSRNRIDDEDWNSEDGNNNDGSNYRYNGNNFDSLKTEQQKQLEKMERALDSTKEVRSEE